VISHFPEWDEVATSHWVRAMRIRHLAAMSTGHHEDALERVINLDPTNLVRGFLRLPPDSEPGTVFAYNNAATYVLGAVVQRVTGMRLVDYLRPRLFDPLGIEQAYWLERGGLDYAFSGLHLTTESVAKLGSLYLADGRWNGQRLLPAGWVAEATRVHTPNPGEPNPDWQQGYGYQLWRSRHGYRADGAYGQFCLVLPEQDAVVVTTAAVEDMQTLLDAVWGTLLPAFDKTSAASQDQALAERLAAAALMPRGAANPMPAGLSGRALSWRPSTSARDAVAALEQLRLDAGPDGLRLTLMEAGVSLDVGVGLGCWITSDTPASDGTVRPVAASGGWDGASLTVDLIFLDTPHRLRLTCPVNGEAFDASWVTLSLHGSTALGHAAPRAVAVDR
jgi:Beta-lactamase